LNTAIDVAGETINTNVMLTRENEQDPERGVWLRKNIASQAAGFYISVRSSGTFYNQRRPHLSLNIKTPTNVHLQKSRLPEATGII
jgi:transposase InsO family protein